MSRLTDALRVLLGKCTPAGTQPVGDKLDDFVECLAGHYDSNQMLVTVTETDGVYSADKKYDDIKNALENGKLVTCKYDERVFYLTRFMSGGAIFCTLGYTYEDDVAIIKTANIYSIRITAGNKIVFYSKALS